MKQSKEHDAARGTMASEALKLLDKGETQKALAAVNPAAIRTFLGAVQRAASLDEIEIVFRYQQARDPRQWESKLVERILKLMREAASRVAGGTGAEGDRTQVQAASEQLSLIARVHRVAYTQATMGEAGDAG